MKYFSVLLAVIAGSAFVSAAPSQANALNARDCPSGYQACGVSLLYSSIIPCLGYVELTDGCGEIDLHW